jgi:N-acetyl-alpha-D-glucosaminyl L-malate synthase BshA
VHYAVPHATAALLAKSMLAEAERPAIVATLHGTDTTLLGADPGYGPAIRHALENVDAVTTVSHFLKAETQRLLGVQRSIDVVHNFFEPKPVTRSREAVRAELGVKPDEVMLLHLSNLRPLKRVDLLLESIAQVRNRSGIKLVVLAGGDFEPYVQRVRDLGLEDRVMVKYSVLDVDNYLNAADLGVFTSETESFCLSILELMAFGVASVSTSVGGIPEVVRSGVEGVLVDAAEPVALGREIQRLIEDPSTRSALGAAGQKKARERFSAAAILPEYLSIYHRVIKR